MITTQGRGAVTSDPDGKVSHAHDVVFSELKVRHVIGASLSEPHTSGTALRKCANIRMCLLDCLLVCGHIP